MKTDRRLGICQLCTRQHKLTDSNLMVHHGYEVPGGVGIVGDCDGAGELPIELSCELVKGALVLMQKKLLKAQAVLVSLQSDDLASVRYPEPAKRRGEPPTWVTIEKAVVGAFTWSARVGEQVSRTEHQIHHFTSDVAALTASIAAWKPTAIRIVSEESIEKAAEEVRTARAKDSAKKAEDKATAAAKRDVDRLAREARMMDVIQAARETFLMLAAERDASEVSGDDTAQKVRILVGELVKKKTIAHGHFWADDLKIDDVLISFGLAHRPPGCRPNFTFNPGYTDSFCNVTN